MSTNALWWITTCAGALGAAAAALASQTTGLTQTVSLAISGLLSLVLGYLHPGKVSPDA